MLIFVKPIPLLYLFSLENKTKMSRDHDYR